MRSVGAKMAAGFGLALVLLSIIGVTAYGSIREIVETDRRVTHTYQVIENLESLLGLLADAETGQRGFVITGREEYLEPYNAAAEPIDRTLRDLDRLTRDNPDQGQRLRRLTSLVALKRTTLREAIDVRRTSGFGAAQGRILTQRGKVVMDEIRAVVAAMEKEERDLLSVRTRKAQASARRTMAVITWGVPLAFLLLAGVAAVITRDIARPLREVTAVAERIATGDLAVAVPPGHRRDEVGALARSFSRMTAWLRQMADVARQIADGNLEVTVVPLSERDELGVPFAVMIRNLRRVTTDLRAQAERLQVQGEELAATNEELRAANEELQAQAEELRAQQQELAQAWGESKRAEEALRESDRKFRAALAHAGITVFAQDRNLHYTWAHNSRFGFTEDTYLGRTDADIFPADQAERLTALKRRVLETGRRAHENVALTVAGETFIYDEIIEPLRDEEGSIVGIIASTEDITERKQAEEQLRQLNEELERRVRERTAELENANKELESFSYSVSHDLRAPLRSIDGFSKILEERYTDVVDARGQDYLARVRAAAQRMGQLIDDILGLSRATRAEMHRGRVDLSALAEEVMRGLRQSQPERQAEIRIAPGMATEGDANLLRIVLENLLGNAWKYTGKRAVAHIEFEAHAENGERVYCIRDNGAGFDPAYKEKLFGPFQRLHTEADFPGTGIGLALVQRIIRRHGGRVWGEGAVEQGATFCFTLGEKR